MSAGKETQACFMLTRILPHAWTNLNNCRFRTAQISALKVRRDADLPVSYVSFRTFLCYKFSIIQIEQVHSNVSHNPEASYRANGALCSRKPVKRQALT